MEHHPRLAPVPEDQLPSETTMSGGRPVAEESRAQVARYVQHVQAGVPLVPMEANAWIDTRTVRGVLRTALLNRVERFGEREVKQRSSQEIGFVLMAFAVAALVAAPALVPLVVALRGGQL